MNPTYPITVCIGTNHDLLCRTVFQKCRKVNICSFFGLRLMSRIFEEFQHLAIQIKIVQSYGGFFQQIKVRQPINSKKGFHTNRDPNKQERLDSFLIFVSNGTTLVQIHGRYLKLPYPAKGICRIVWLFEPLFS
jgi:hypothetical protein